MQMTYYEKNKERLKAYAIERWLKLKKERPVIPPAPKGFVNYKVHNFCAVCRIKYSKDIRYCEVCNHRVRTKAWASNYNRNKRY